MEKDKTIHLFLERLKQKSNFHLVEIVDYWEADLCAIGLKRGNKLAYISTYKSLGLEEIRYDYDLELMDAEISSNMEVVKEGRDCEEAELFMDVRRFLDF